MQNNSPTLVSKRKNSFSNFVFQIANHKIKQDLRSESLVESFDDKGKSSKQTQTNFRSKTNVNLSSPRKVEIFRENSTQTSKTVVAMVQTEHDVRLSPDSLSPKQGPKKSTVLNDEVISMMESVLTVKELDSLPFNRRSSIIHSLDSCEEIQRRKLLSGNSLTKAFLARVRNRTGQPPMNPPSPKQYGLVFDKSSPKTEKTPSPILKSQSYVESPARKELFDTKEIKTIRMEKPTRFEVKNVTEKRSSEDKTKPVKYYTKSKASNSISTRRSTSFMSPTFASEQKDQRIEMRSIEKLISPTKRGRSLSPKKPMIVDIDDSETKKVPYFDKSNESFEANSKNDDKVQNKRKDKYDLDQGVEDLHLNLTLSFDNMTNTTISITSSTSTECILFQAISKLRDQNWNIALRGLAEIVEICRVLDNDVIFPHMTAINQRLIELVKSSRSHVCRTACQAVGHLFEYVKDTRRPEFDELIDTLLYKTADSNKFIRHDANLALDCMVTHVAIFHAVRSICSKGPDHKNQLVRTAAARLLVCAVVIAGPENILHPHSNEYTRKRIILNMVKFMNDKSLETRKFGQRLYKLLYKERIFDIYLKRYLEKDVIYRLKKCMKSPR